MVPRQFCEFYVRVWSKSEAKMPLVKAMYKRWCESTGGHGTPVTPGEFKSLVIFLIKQQTRAPYVRRLRAPCTPCATNLASCPPSSSLRHSACGAAAECPRSRSRNGADDGRWGRWCSASRSSNGGIGVGGGSERRRKSQGSAADASAPWAEGYRGTRKQAAAHELRIATNCFGMCTTPTVTYEHASTRQLRRADGRHWPKQAGADLGRPHSQNPV